MPDGRTIDYAKWRACERFGMSPPDIEGRSWDDLTAWQQALLIAYNQIREHEEMEFACIGLTKGL